MAETEREKPVSITRASFQAASNYVELKPEVRRFRRAQTRRDWRPPGLIAQRWVVHRSFHYDVGHLGSDECHIVPKGFEFDGASVPFPLTVLVPQSHSLYLAASALHDWFYHQRSERGSMSREQADAIFRESMIVLGLNWVWAGLMWRAVRAGGWAVWDAQTPGTFAHWLARRPWLFRTIVASLISWPRGVAGTLFIDLFNLAAYRADAQRLRGQDAAGLID